MQPIDPRSSQVKPFARHNSTVSLETQILARAFRSPREAPVPGTSSLRRALLDAAIGVIAARFGGVAKPGFLSPSEPPSFARPGIPVVNLLSPPLELERAHAIGDRLPHDKAGGADLTSRAASTPRFGIERELDLLPPVGGLPVNYFLNAAERFHNATDVVPLAFRPVGPRVELQFAATHAPTGLKDWDVGYRGREAPKKFGG